MQSPVNLYMLEVMRRFVKSSIWVVAAVCVFFGMATPPASAAPAAPRANGLLYYRADNPATGLPGIFAATEQGAEARLISPNLADNQFDRPSLSPDGSKIVYQQLDTLGAGTGSLIIANSDGSNTQTLIAADPDIDVLYPVWAPDGSRIAYVSYDLDTTAVTIRTISPDGSDNQLLPIVLSDTPFAGSVTPIAWSASDVLAFIDNDDVFVANLDGTGKTNLTSEAGWTDAYSAAVSWSPDGSKLAFTAFVCPDTGGRSCLATMNADGSQKTIIALGEMPPSGPGCTLYIADLAWSPDGSKIAFSKRNGCVI